jgi:hypothetical protein
MSFPERRKQNDQENRTNERKNLLMDQNMKNRLSENSSKEFEKYRQNCLKWTLEEWPKLSKEQQEDYKHIAAERWGAMSNSLKEKTFVVFRILEKCPYNKVTWYADNFHLGPIWAADHANERPKTKFVDGYQVLKDYQPTDSRSAFQTWK